MTGPCSDKRTCRFCGGSDMEVFLDLGFSPPSNFFLREDDLNRGERHYPLRAYVCSACHLVQADIFEAPEALFSNDYAYFSSYSTQWLAHARAYVEMAIPRFNLGTDSLVVEIASNDGYLLQNFLPHAIPVLGIEPAANCAAVARDTRKVPTIERFFNVETARHVAEEFGRADLIIGNNVLAHVPHIGAFADGLAIALKERGVITMEFPHLLRQIEENQFDTIYHEHFSYLSLLAVRAIFAKSGLDLFDVEELPTHGGSLRIFAGQSSAGRTPSESVRRVLAEETAAGLAERRGYLGFAERARRVKFDLLSFLLEARAAGKTVAAYGAPAKGNTLLNYCGIRDDLLAFTVDMNPHKQGRYLPGSHLRIDPPDRIFTEKPDYVLILPWNLRDEICRQMAGIGAWGGKFVVAIPQLEIIS